MFNYRRFGSPIFESKAVRKDPSWTAWLLKMGNVHRKLYQEGKKRYITVVVSVEIERNQTANRLHNENYTFCFSKEVLSRFQSPRGLRLGSAAACLLGLWVSESRRGWESLSLVSVVCFQGEVSASGWSFVQRSPNECGVSEWWSWSVHNEEGLANWGLFCHEYKEDGQTYMAVGKQENGDLNYWIKNAWTLTDTACRKLPSSTNEVHVSTLGSSVEGWK
jgi:hypothetical protein